MKSSRYICHLRRSFTRDTLLPIILVDTVGVNTLTSGGTTCNTVTTVAMTSRHSNDKSLIAVNFLLDTINSFMENLMILFFLFFQFINHLDDKVISSLALVQSILMTFENDIILLLLSEIVPTAFSAYPTSVETDLRRWIVLILGLASLPKPNAILLFDIFYFFEFPLQRFRHYRIKSCYRITFSSA